MAQPYGGQALVCWRQRIAACCGMDLAVEPDPKPEDIRLLEEQINAFNEASTGITDGKLLAVFLREADGSSLGGLFGWTWGGTCYVRFLFVPTHLRRQGYGSRLMAMVETEARARGCHQIALETHDFQAPAFYERLGFRVTGGIEAYPLGYRQLTMVKPLGA